MKKEQSMTNWKEISRSGGFIQDSAAYNTYLNLLEEA